MCVVTELPIVTNFPAVALSGLQNRSVCGSAWDFAVYNSPNAVFHRHSIYCQYPATLYGGLNSRVESAQVEIDEGCVRILRSYWESVILTMVTTQPRNTTE